MRPIRLSVLDYLELHQVPAAHRPRWLRLLVAMEQTYALAALARVTKLRHQELPDGVA